MVKQKYLDKAEILIEALPYIQRFSGKIIVIKYGGSAMLDDELKMKVIKDAVLLKLVGFKPVIVHGGGKEINRWVDKVGMEHEFIDGFRVTDGDTMELVEMVLSKVNKDLVAKVQSLGVNAAGISGKDGGLIKVKKKMPEGKDIGFVGDIISVDTKLVEDLIEKDFLPVIFPLGMDDEFNTYNVNADEAAAAIATGLHAEKLVYLSDVEGVREDPDDPESVLSELFVHEAEELIEKGVISGGMLPKIQNCIDALKGGITRIHIMDGRIPHSLLLEIFTNKGIGTAILSDEEEKYWDGKH
ncbi:MAG: acetylglutamate kinase [Eubacteriales bacterium]|nr:acetylglutamate kinase [Clostridiales bacterium]MDD7307329.1 acetylglutamate kinase [Eubacteriales bacterium]MDY2934141.1 acetylglutamate kinase [Anaerovoracaceae bacterium]